MVLRTALVATALVLAGGLLRLDAQRAWVEIRSPHFVVSTDVSDRAGRDVAWQFEQVRTALKTVWPNADVDLDRPVTVIAVRNEEAMRELAPSFWETRNGVRPATVFVSGPDRHYIALRTDVISNDQLARANPYQQAYWSFSSLVISATFGRNLPTWLSRGLASVMSNTIVTDDGIQVGRLPPSSWERLQGTGRLRLPELLAVDTQSQWFTDPDRRQLFEAQATVFTHYLMFGDKGIHRESLNTFVNLVATGASAEGAFTQAFKDATAVEDGFRLYLQRSLFAYNTIAVDTAVRRDSFTARPLSAAEAAARRAAFHASMQRPVEARALVAEARKTAATLATASEVEALLFERENKLEEARAAYGQAVEAGSTNFYALYRWAAMTWKPQGQDDATRTRVDAVAEKSVRANNRFSPSLGLLADIKTALGKHDEAVLLLRRASEVAPDRPSHRARLAQILWTAGQRDEAKVEAERALQASTNENDRRYAQSVVDFMSRAPATAVRPITPASADSSTTSSEFTTTAGPAGGTSRPAESLSLDIGAACRGGNTPQCRTVTGILTSGCRDGNATSCAILGQAYALGEGVPQDLVKAADFYLQACERGSNPACLNLALMQAEGRGIPRNLAAAIAATDKICQQNYLEGCTAQATFLLRSANTVERERGRQLLAVTCARSHAPACEVLKALPR